ncbi:MAG: hypothetical protein J6T82_08520 [Bacteroidaceae bacterium]|nr:hypothetical protein [Bacteroidaceae bacterium]
MNNNNKDEAIILTKEDKLFLLNLARQGFVTDADKSILREKFFAGEPQLLIRCVSTKAEVEELHRLDELRKNFHIDGDCGVLMENDPMVKEVFEEIDRFRNGLA